jgi:hypothetical protein
MTEEAPGGAKVVYSFLQVDIRARSVFNGPFTELCVDAGRLHSVSLTSDVRRGHILAQLFQTRVLGGHTSLVNVQKQFYDHVDVMNSKLPSMARDRTCRGAVALVPSGRNKHLQADGT